MSCCAFNLLNLSLKKIRLAFIVFLACIPMQYAYSQENYKTEVQVTELVKQNSKQLEKGITDSTALYKDLLRAKFILEQRQETKLLAQSYQNLAIWHNSRVSIDSVEYYYNKASSTYNKIRLTDLEAETYLLLEDAYKKRSDYSAAMAMDFKALSIFENLDNKSGIAKVYTRLCDILYYQQEHRKGADYCQKAIEIQSNLNQPDELAISYRYKADNLLILGEYEKALNNINQAIDVLSDAKRSLNDIAPNYNTRGNIYKYLERYEDAIKEYARCYDIAKANNNYRGLISSLGNIGHVYRLQENYESALPYTLEAIELSKESGNTQNLAENYMHAADSYKAIGDFEKSLAYERLFSKEKIENLSTIIDQLESELQIKYETDKKNKTIENQEAKLERQQMIQQLYFGIGFLLLVILVGMYFTIKNNKKKRMALLNLNEKIYENQAKLKKSNIKLKASIEELKATQQQLIQSEKMASLGELTAGIAHEIQNPLNFVNNFSELNKELVQDAYEEFENKDYEEVKVILKDIEANSEKINHHGKRADSIVKGMLQHSRSSNGKKEPTDINALADEYMRLAYHGLRAKDKSFNAELVTDFDESIGKIDIIPQDIGRVILNLLTNAFYAVNEKKKSPLTPASPSGRPKGGNTYKPTVKITTGHSPLKGGKGGVIITVTDNGNGIPNTVKHKIFQPFFTTKPTGSGTGLGLSLSYDIVKAHDGEMKVESQEGVGTTFSITLPFIINHIS